MTLNSHFTLNSVFFKFKICLFTYMDSAMISLEKAYIIYFVKVTCIHSVSLYKDIKYFVAIKYSET